MNFHTFEESILYSNFNSKTAFAIFYSDVVFLQSII